MQHGCLKKLGAEVTVSDQQPLEKNSEAQELQTEGGYTILTGEQTPSQLDAGFDLMVKNPGIPYDVPLIKQPLIKSCQSSLKLN